MSQRAVTQAQELEIIRRYKGGDTISNLAHTYECSKKAIRAVFVRQGVESRGVERVPRQFSDDLIEDIVSRWNAGAIPRQIAKDVGVGREAVRRLLRDAGYAIQTRDRSPGPVHSDSSSWRGGRITTPEDYIKIKIATDDPMYEMADSRGYVLEHRLTVARDMGKPLRKNQSVHHIDGNRSNNDLSNLQLRHEKTHGKGTVRKCSRCANGCTKCNAYDIRTGKLAGL